jgi:hypothetical protein
MLIQSFVTSHQIIFPFSFISSTSFKNSKCFFGSWEKK